MTLNDIGLRCGTDKAHLHRYLEFYDSILSPYREKEVSVLEIGILGGESIRMWSEYFSNTASKIYGVDIHDRNVVIEDPRVQLIIGDGTQPSFIFNLTQITGSFDIIVDDGSHFSAHQKDTLRLLWPHLKSGGVFIVEDVFTSFTYPWTKPDEVSFVENTMDWIKEVHEYGGGHVGVPSETATIEEIVIRKGVHVFKKRLTQPA